MTNTNKHKLEAELEDGKLLQILLISKMMLLAITALKITVSGIQ